MTASMRIFLVVALVVAGGFAMVRLFDGQTTGAATSSPASTAVSPAASGTVAATTPPPTTTSADTAVPVTVPVTVPATEPPASTLPAVLSSFCPTSTHAAVVDRDRQSAWLCDAGVAVYEFPFTGAISQPDPGTYPVYAKDMNSSASSSRGVSTMTHFVAFTHGKFRGARIAFHSLPVWQTTGEWVQPPDSVGEVGRRGESAGCLRVLPDDAVRVWDWLAEGDEVRVIN
jgi:hypothetical protein